VIPAARYRLGNAFRTRRGIRFTCLSVNQVLDLRFLLILDSPHEDEDEVMTWLVTALPEAEREKENSCRLRLNYVEVWPNSDADPEAARSKRDGYLFYRYRIEVSPILGEVAKGGQINLAREVLGYARGERWRWVVCANFEDEVDPDPPQ